MTIPSELTGGTGKHYDVHAFKGKVIGASKHMETKVSGGGGGGYTYQGTGASGQVSITSTTVVHDQFFLQGDNGKELALKLQSWDVAVRDGQDLTALWAIREGKNSGPFIVIHNHNTNETRYNDGALDSIFSLPGWWIPVPLLAGIVLPWYIGVLGAVGVFIYRKQQCSKRVKEFKSSLSFA